MPSEKGSATVPVALFGVSRTAGAVDSIHHLVCLGERCRPVCGMPTGAAKFPLSLLVLFRLVQELERPVEQRFGVFVFPLFHQRLELLHNFCHCGRVAAIILPALDTILDFLQFRLKEALDFFRRTKLSRGDFAFDVPQLRLLLTRELVSDSENQGQMRALDLAFLVQNLVELSQDGLLLHLLPLQKRGQGLYFFLKSLLKVAETLLGLLHFGNQSVPLLLGKPDVRLVLYHQLRREKILGQRISGR